MGKIIGPIIMVGSTFFYALITPLTKKINEKTPPFTVMTVSMFALFFGSLILSLLLEKGSYSKLMNQRNSIVVLLLAGLFNVAAFWLWIKAYSHMLVWQQEMFQLLTPIFGAIVAYFILGETISAKLFIGLLLVGLGLYISVK